MSAAEVVPDPLAPGRHGAPGDDPVRIGAAPRGAVQLLARKGRAEEVRTRVRNAVALELPPPGGSAVAGEIAALWMRPDGWLLLAPLGVEGAFARRVKDAVGDAASVVDQTHGSKVFTLAGPRAAWVLAKLCRIDLHPTVFGPGSVAATPVAGLACLVRQVDAEPGYELVVKASLARSFGAALAGAAEEVGYIVS